MTLVFLALALLGTPASALASPELSYDAPAGCPVQSEFSEAVAAYGGDLSAGDEADPGRILVVSIRQQGNAFVGSFQVRRSSGVTDSRDVRSATCAEVAEALAMVTAISLHASTAQSAADPPVPAPPQPAVRAPDSPAADLTSSDRLRASTEFFPRRVDTLRVEAGELRFDLARTISVTFGGTVGLVPSTLLPRYEVTQTIAHFVTTPSGRQRIVGLVYQINADFLGTGTYRSPDTKTDVYGMSFGFSFCQSPLYDSRGLSVLLCGGYGGGYLNLATSTLDGTSIQTKNAGFGTINAAAEVQYNLGSHLLLSARGGGTLAIGDIGAERANGTRIFKSSPWSGSVMLGLGLRF